MAGEPGTSAGMYRKGKTTEDEWSRDAIEPLALD